MLPPGTQLGKRLRGGIFSEIVQSAEGDGVEKAKNFLGLNYLFSGNPGV